MRDPRGQVVVGVGDLVGVAVGLPVADGLTDGLGDTLAGSTPHFTVGLGR